MEIDNILKRYLSFTPGFSPVTQSCEDPETVSTVSPLAGYLFFSGQLSGLWRRPNR